MGIIVITNVDGVVTIDWVSTFVNMNTIRKCLPVTLINY